MRVGLTIIFLLGNFNAMSFPPSSSDINFFNTGVVSSPNYPNNYPDSIERSYIIEVEEGLIVALQFTAFDIEYESTCRYDHLAITDSNGRSLMEKGCGTDGSIVIGDQSIDSSLPPNITSTSNMVDIHFSSDSGRRGSGFRIKWTAVTPGKGSSPEKKMHSFGHYPKWGGRALPKFFSTSKKCIFGH